jgi:hypothetical protein
MFDAFPGFTCLHAMLELICFEFEIYTSLQLLDKVCVNLIQLLVLMSFSSLS